MSQRPNRTMDYMFFLCLVLVLKISQEPKKEWSTNRFEGLEGSQLALFQKQLRQ